MDQFLDWYNNHNTLIIQVLAAVIAVFIILFIFKLLFQKQNQMQESFAQDGLGLHPEKLNKLDLKIDQIIENQKNFKFNIQPSVTDSDLSTQPSSVSSEPSQKNESLELLKLEIKKLNDQLTEKDAEILILNSSIPRPENEGSSVVSGLKTGGQNQDLDIKLLDYEKQINILKSRLADYDIIVDDLADLQKFKKENEDLKKQLATLESSQNLVEDASSRIDSAVLQQPAKTTEEPQETIVEIPKVPEEVKVKDQELSQPKEDQFPEPKIAAELNTKEALELSAGVTNEEKSLLDEFEKNFIQDED